MKRLVTWAALAALALVMASAAPASAAAEAPKLGVVDMARVAAEYRLMNELNQQLQDFQGDQERQLQEKQKTRLLTDEERQDYADLSAMAAPTDPNKKRLQELEKLSDTREQLVTELSQKQQRTAEEEAELKQWGDLYRKRMSELASLQAELQASRLTKYQELSKRVADNVNTAT